MNDISTGWTPLEEVPQEVKDEVRDEVKGEVSYEKYGQPTHEKVLTYKLRYIGTDGRLLTLWVVRLEHDGDDVFVYQFIPTGPILLPE